MALFAASGVFLMARFSRDPVPRESVAPAVAALTITCLHGGGARIGADAVQMQSDGVHISVDDAVGEGAVYIRDPHDNGNFLGQELSPDRMTNGLYQLSPGTYVAGCFSGSTFNASDVPLSAYSAPFDVVDPGGFYPKLVDATTCSAPLPPLASTAGEAGGGSTAAGTITAVARDPANGMTQVLMVAADGSSSGPLIDLPAGTGDLRAAQLSPDGRKIAIEIADSNGDGPHVIDAATEDGEIWIANADGSGLTKLTDNHSEDEFVGWTPDGSRLTFASNRITERDRNRTLYTMALDGSDVRPLLPPGWDADAFSWSPDGSQLAFVGHDRGNGSDGCRTNSEIYVVPADGSSPPVALTDDELWEQNPAWSPDGTKIAYQVSQQSDQRWDIMVMNADGSDQVRLTDAGYDTGPVWSPDGGSIAFTSDRSLPNSDQRTQGAVWVMGADGAGQRPLFTATDLGVAGDELWVTAWQLYE